MCSKTPYMLYSPLDIITAFERTSPLAFCATSRYSYITLEIDSLIVSVFVCVPLAHVKSSMISTEQDGRYLYVGMGQYIPEQILMGILVWFGIDIRRDFEERRFFDNSRFFVQKQVA